MSPTDPEGDSGLPDGSSRGILRIDLAALACNWRRLAGLATGAECAAAVKADAYGLGLDAVAPALWQAGCRTFFVAHLEEGVGLRARLPAARVFVLHGVRAADAATMAAFDLVPVLNDEGQVAAWRDAARRTGRRLPAALHVDTGMNRLGLEPAVFQRLTDDPGHLDGLEPVLVMSHLACADQPDHPLNTLQRTRFAHMAARLPAVPASLANSAGILLGAGHRFDLVRPGIALYGGNPRTSGVNPMDEVVRLQGRIVQVRSIDVGGAVGYGAHHPVIGGERIATVAIGYADGYPRSSGGRAVAGLDGWRVPVVGRVSMDLLSLDVSAVPETVARPGALVDLIGGCASCLDDLAARADGFSYEILTRLGHRARRVYAGMPDGGPMPADHGEMPA